MMILVDSSVWIDHFRVNNRVLQVLLDDGEVLSHSFVIGEIAVGSLHKRSILLEFFDSLPQTILATDDEVLAFIEKHSLFGLGLGYIDCHLLASSVLSSVRLWTRDKRLQEVAVKLGVGFKLDTLTH